MKRNSTHNSMASVLRVALVASILGITVFGSIAEARQGCGVGRHRCYRTGGNCVPNGVCVQEWYHGGCWVNGHHRRHCN